MNRHSEIITTGPVSIETYVDGDGNGPDVVVLPSYGRDGGEDFDPFSAALAEAGYRVLRPQPRGTARSAGPMTGVTHVRKRSGPGIAWGAYATPPGKVPCRRTWADAWQVSRGVRRALGTSLPGRGQPLPRGHGTASRRRPRGRGRGTPCGRAASPGTS